jgi:hypothetical protein
MNRIARAQPFGSVTWATSVGGRKVGSLIHRIDTLRFAYFQLKRHAAAGVDGETWRHYGEALEENLQSLSHT